MSYLSSLRDWFSPYSLYVTRVAIVNVIKAGNMIALYKSVQSIIKVFSRN